jgi:hypothetical protein
VKVGSRCRSRCVLDLVTQPHHAALERFAADQTQRLPCAGFLILVPVIVNDALNPGQAINGRIDQRAELIDQPLLQERAIDPTASLKEQRLDAEDGAELLQRKGKVVALRAGKDVGDAVLAQLGQLGIRHLLAQDGDRVIASDIVLAIVDPASRVDSDRKVPAIAVCHMRLARDLWSIGYRQLASPCHLGHCLAADDPALRPKLTSDLLIMPAQYLGWNAGRRHGEAAGMEAAVDGGDHVADDVGAHGYDFSAGKG